MIEFSTTVTDGYNLFGRLLAAGDHAFSSSSFATKIFGVGVALEGYLGMDAPSANASTINYAGATSPSDPSLSYLDPNALAATPYVYLIPNNRLIGRSVWNSKWKLVIPGQALLSDPDDGLNRFINSVTASLEVQPTA